MVFITDFSNYVLLMLIWRFYSSSKHHLITKQQGPKVHWAPGGSQAGVLRFAAMQRFAFVLRGLLSPAHLWSVRSATLSSGLPLNSFKIITLSWVWQYMAARRLRQEDANSRSAWPVEEVQRQHGQFSETLPQNKQGLKGSWGYS